MILTAIALLVGVSTIAALTIRSTLRSIGRAVTGIGRTS